MAYRRCNVSKKEYQFQLLIENFSVDIYKSKVWFWLVWFMFSMLVLVWLVGKPG